MIVIKKSKIFHANCKISTECICSSDLKHCFLCLGGFCGFGGIFRECHFCLVGWFLQCCSHSSSGLFGQITVLSVLTSPPRTHLACLHCTVKRPTWALLTSANIFIQCNSSLAEYSRAYYLKNNTQYYLCNTS